MWDYPAKGKFTHCVHLQNNQLCHRYCQTLPIKRPAFPRKLTISWDCPIKDGGMSLGSRQHKEPSCMQSWIEYILSLRWDSYFHRILPLLEMRFLVTQNTSSRWDEILSSTEYILSLRGDSYFHRMHPLLEMRFLVTQNTSSLWEEILSSIEYILSLRGDP